jgi:hypothetical protein
MGKDRSLLGEMSPCDTDIYDTSIRTIDDARAKGPNYCPRYYLSADKGPKCDPTYAACALRFGKDVAKYVARGSTLEAELDELENKGVLKGKTFVTTKDRKTFEEVRGADKVLAEIKRIAKLLLA